MIALTAFWCLYEAAFKAISWTLIGFLFVGEVLEVVVEIWVGTVLIELGFAPVGKLGVGYLLDSYSLVSVVVVTVE